MLMADSLIHVLLPVLHQTLQDLRDLPARHLQELAMRLAQLSSADTPDVAPLFIAILNHL